MLFNKLILFPFLVFLHSLIRWAVLGSLLYSLYRAYIGYQFSKDFTKADNALRHWTATIAHIQLMIGILVYSKSAAVKSFFAGFGSRDHITEPIFFGVIHMALMLTAIILITIGSAAAKRKSTAHDQFKTILIWFGAALLLILMAIPWPFSPFAQRPYLRPF